MTSITVVERDRRNGDLFIASPITRGYRVEPYSWYGGKRFILDVPVNRKPRIPTAIVPESRGNFYVMHSDDRESRVGCSVSKYWTMQLSDPSRAQPAQKASTVSRIAVVPNPTTSEALIEYELVA